MAICMLEELKKTKNDGHAGGIKGLVIYAK